MKFLDEFGNNYFENGEENNKEIIVIVGQYNEKEDSFTIFYDLYDNDKPEILNKINVLLRFNITDEEKIKKVIEDFKNNFENGKIIKEYNKEENYIIFEV